MAGKKNVFLFFFLSTEKPFKMMFKNQTRQLPLISGQLVLGHRLFTLNTIVRLNVFLDLVTVLDNCRNCRDLR
jgi:hypothetical protein